MLSCMQNGNFEYVNYFKELNLLNGY